MPRGGSKPGKRRGGRKKGTRNRKLHPRRISAAEGIALAKRFDHSPLEVILDKANGDKRFDHFTPQQVDWMIAAAPYVHPRLAAVAWVPPNDGREQQRRDMPRGLNYQQGQAILDILATAQPLQIESAAAEGVSMSGSTAAER